MGEEQLAEVDEALAALGKSDDDVSEVRNRFVQAEPADLESVDAELRALAQDAAIETRSVESVASAPEQAEPSEESWDDENTDVEVLDESDFVLLVDEGELEELEKAGEDESRMTCPPPVPQQDEADEGFFKKLFGGRRSSNRP